MDSYEIARQVAGKFHFEQSSLNSAVANMFFAAAQQSEIAATESMLPYVLMKPLVFPDGDKWCALYGKNLQDGVCGFGNTPEGACHDFNRNWQTQTLAARAQEKEEE